MTPLVLQDFHKGLNAQFTEVNGAQTVADYGDVAGEYQALHDTAGVLDLSFRGRLCVTGADRARFLNGQVTNNVKDLRAGEGCYAALVTAHGKIQSDLNIYNLPDELLLDFEPGLGAVVVQRLEKYVIADDAQIVDASPHYGLLSVQGPKAADVIGSLELQCALPQKTMSLAVVDDGRFGQLYLVNQARLGTTGFDLYAPVVSLSAVMGKLVTVAQNAGGRACGWTAFETARIETGIPRFGVDMDETNLAPETGIEARAISYSKGCYIGQEVIARIRTYGQVAKALRGLRLADDLKTLPPRGAKLTHNGREVGYVTSVVASPKMKRIIALGYVRKEANAIGTELTLVITDGECKARVVALPFQVDS